jgi:hypothetical protein
LLIAVMSMMLNWNATLKNLDLWWTPLRAATGAAIRPPLIARE